MRHLRGTLLLVVLLHMALLAQVVAQSTSVTLKGPAQPYFRIKVVDQETSRGIPAVKLEMTNLGQYWTDSAGVIAFYEPDLMNQQVWFTVETHGYVNENAPMGFNGIVLVPKPGGTAIVPMRRVNIAQRIYRLTGSGIYRDSLLLGDPAPAVIEEGKFPPMGQDGCDVTLFKGKYYWLWGDTNVPRFPLGVYQGTCAASELPENGGLDPDKGVALHYLRKDDGELRPVINLPLKPGSPYWYTQPRVVRDHKGADHFVTDYTNVDDKMRPVGRGVVEYSEKTGLFEPLAKYPDDHAIFATEGGGTTVFRHTVGSKEYFYHPAPYPVVRYPTDYASQTDMGTREAFTCLKEGSRFDGSAAQIDRDKQGSLRWGWKKNTSPIGEKEMEQYIKVGLMKPEEQWYSVKDVDTGIRVISHQGSVYWNPYRQRWICIRAQNFGLTLIGEVWYLEGDTPMGPWVYARKIITHAWKEHTASFYVPAQIPYFDRDNGRTIYLKGSFSGEYGDQKVAPPRHNYNAMVYKVQLDDPRLFLPVPVYHAAGKDERYGTKEAFPGKAGNLDIAWFAPDRPASGTVAVYQAKNANGKGIHLTLKEEGDAKAAFFAKPARTAATSSTLSQTVPLYEFTHSKSGKHIYSTGESVKEEGFVRSPEPVCEVWANPILFNPFGKRENALW